MVKFSKQYQAELEKNIQNSQEEFYEFYGVLMGDGCLTLFNESQKIKRSDIIISGDKRYEMDYYLYLKNLLGNTFNIHAYVYQYNKNNTIRIIIRNRVLSDILIKIGFPTGKKYANLLIPQSFLQSTWEKKKFLIRGLFDTDGTIFAKKNEGYKYPYIGFSSKNKTLIEQIKVLLRERGYPFYTNYNNLFMKRIGNVKRWMGDVGTSNPKHRFKYEYWVKYKKLPAYLLGQ